MNTSPLSTLSEQMADVVAAIAPSVVQVQGHRRPISGVVHGTDVVLTNARALGREEGLRVRAPDGRTIEAELAGWDAATGLALLRAAGLGLDPPRLADTAVRVGHILVAAGRSWSNALTASAGIVAVVGGPLRTGRRRAIEQVIRTTAPMHDGFAGGAVVDASGGLIGIATAGEIRGLAVVIPASIAWKAGAEMLRHGQPRRGFLGIAAQPVQLADRQRGGTSRERGLLTVAVTPDGPAERAGLLVGDVLLEFDGQPLESPDELLDLLTADRVGASSTVKILRAGAPTEVSVTIAERGSR